MKEGLKFFGISTVVWFWMVALVIAASLIGLAFYQVQLNLERKAQIHSTGYVQAQVDQMSKDLTQFQKNEVDLQKYSDNTNVVKTLKIQQMGIVQDMWSAYDQIPQDAKDSVPNDLIEFLNSHPRNWQP